MNCHWCGINENIPFVCNYCGESFCDLHRIPMNHSCANLNQYMQNRQRRMQAGDEDQHSLHSFSSMIRIKSSKTELLHLGIATLLVTAVGLSLNSYRYISWQFITIFVSAFLVHELAHKFLAQFYGSWAEFRGQLYGLLITAISAIPIIPFKFIAPGAVMVGLTDRNRFGRVALIGPLTNLVMGFAFLLLYHLNQSSYFFVAGASFNGWIAMFNLLPFGVLDGQKIFEWNKVVWVSTMALAMILFILSQRIR